MRFLYSKKTFCLILIAGFIANLSYAKSCCTSCAFSGDEQTYCEMKYGKPQPASDTFNALNDEIDSNDFSTAEDLDDLKKVVKSIEADKDKLPKDEYVRLYFNLKEKYNDNRIKFIFMVTKHITTREQLDELIDIAELINVECKEILYLRRTILEKIKGNEKEPAIDNVRSHSFSD